MVRIGWKDKYETWKAERKADRVQKKKYEAQYKSEARQAARDAYKEERRKYLVEKATTAAKAEARRPSVMESFTSSLSRPSPKRRVLPYKKKSSYSKKKKGKRRRTRRNTGAQGLTDIFGGQDLF